MNDIICPHCNKAFKVDEAGYADILKQVHDSEFEQQLHERLFLAAQIKANDKAFLSKDITVTDIILNRGDIHHVFPRNFLKKHGFPRGKYNQIANFAYTQTETNIKIRDREPKVYFGDVVEQTKGGELSYGAINDPAELKANLIANCIPQELHEMGLDRYDEFLAARRKLMAAKLKTYYSSL